MIGKQVKGKGFRGCLNYVLGKEGAQLIGGNMSGRNARELAAEFRFSRLLNPRVERAVYHATLSLPCRQGYRESLDDDTWNEIAASYLERMGFTQNQYVAVRHTDTDHDHLHIVASRIRMDGSCVRDGWDYRRSEATIRSLEQHYGLEAVTPSWETERAAPSTGQVRRLKKQEKDYSQGQRDSPAEEIARVKIQQAIDAITLGASLTLTQLIEQLEDAGISMRFNVSRNGDIRGITYGHQGWPFSASSLGAGKNPYTIAGLQERRGVSLELERDHRAIAQRAYNNSGEKHDPKKIQTKILSNSKNQGLQATPVPATPTQELFPTGIPKSNPTPQSTTSNQFQIPAGIQKSNQQPTQPTAPTPQRPEPAHQQLVGNLMSLVDRELKRTKTNKSSGQTWDVWKEDAYQLSMRRHSDGLELQAIYKDARWQPVELPPLSTRDVQALKEFTQRLEQWLREREIEQKKELERQKKQRQLEL